MRERKLRNQFPRVSSLPTQSSKYWVKERDRYIRQLLISDIEELTQRELIVYFSRLDDEITETDADDLSEVMQGIGSRQIDLFLHTPGGFVDAVEKYVTVLRYMADDYRVIVPSWAKSGGTVIALSANKIVLGVNSELGPIDPQMHVDRIGPVPCEFIKNDMTQKPIIRSIAETNILRMQGLATKYLETGMFANKKEEIDKAIDRLSSPTSYGSHGAVIDYSEAVAMGLNVEWIPPSDELWRRIWLLYCLYDYDTKQLNIGKITEGAINSIGRQAI